MSEGNYQNIGDPAKLLLLISILAKDRAISNNSKAFIKEMVLRRDSKLNRLFLSFESNASSDSQFLEDLHNMVMEESMMLYNEIFADTTLEVGKTLSKDERDRKDLHEEKSLIYGEVEYQSFYRVLRKINAQPGQTFYDLGSGTGKAVFAARLTQDFGRCIGIEILQGLHNQAKTIVDRYNTSYRNMLCSSQNQHASVYEGSFLEYDWTDGDVIFANSTCFDDNLMMSMSKMAEGCKPGAIFVTFTKGLNSKAFELLERKRYKMSWGPATVFIHRKLYPDGRSVGHYKLNILPSDAAEYEADESDSAYMSKRNNSSKYDDGDDDGDDDDDDDDDEIYDFGDDVIIDDEDDDVHDYPSGQSKYSADYMRYYGNQVDEEEDDEDGDDDEDDDDEDDDDEDDDDDDSDDDDENYQWPDKSELTKQQYSLMSNKASSPTSGYGSGVVPALLSPTESNQSFSSMNSPQDSALLMRKRRPQPSF